MGFRKRPLVVSLLNRFEVHKRRLFAIARDSGLNKAWCLDKFSPPMNSLRNTILTSFWWLPLPIRRQAVGPTWHIGAGHRCPKHDSRLTSASICTRVWQIYDFDMKEHPSIFVSKDGHRCPKHDSRLTAWLASASIFTQSIQRALKTRRGVHRTRTSN